MTKGNIVDIIASFDKEIEALKKEKKKDYPESIHKLIDREIGNLADNRYRYSLQAKALGIKVD